MKGRKEADKYSCIYIFICCVVFWRLVCIDVERRTTLNHQYQRLHFVFHVDSWLPWKVASAAVGITQRYRNSLPEVGGLKTMWRSEIVRLKGFRHSSSLGYESGVLAQGGEWWTIFLEVPPFNILIHCISYAWFHCACTLVFCFLIGDVDTT